MPYFTDDIVRRHRDAVERHVEERVPGEGGDAVALHAGRIGGDEEERDALGSLASRASGADQARSATRVRDERLFAAQHEAVA